jgi:hypothetical protein
MNREKELIGALETAIQRLEWASRCFGKPEIEIDCFDGRKLTGPEYARDTMIVVGQLRDVIGIS